jgi:hypothetical protein
MDRDLDNTTITSDCKASLCLKHLNCLATIAGLWRSAAIFLDDSTDTFVTRVGATINLTLLARHDLVSPPVL